MRGVVVVSLLLLAPAEVLAGDFELTLGGRIQSNVRFRPVEEEVGDWYARRVLEKGLARNEHILKLKANASVDRFSGVVDVDFVWLGFTPNVSTIDDLSDRASVEETRFEAQAAYVEALDLLPGLDLRVGQQIVAWGVGDQFNPTNSLNADDIEDRLLFGVQQANLMARVDWSLEDWFTLSGVAVPIFRPALLPGSGGLAISAVDRLPHLDDMLRYRLHSESAAALGEGYPTVVNDVLVELPETSFKNIQYMARFSTVIFEQDVSLSFYHGRDDFPKPIRNIARQVDEMRCNPDDPNDCINGLLQTETTLGYPKVQVAGLNLAGEIPIADTSIGYRLELGVFFPRKLEIAMFQENINIAGMMLNGEYDYGLGGDRPLVLDDTPYAKWALGLDYTFNEYVYVNVQWVHGFADETGAGDWIKAGKVVRSGGISAGKNPIDDCINPLDPTPQECAVEMRRNALGDYLVLGIDLHFLSGDLLLRLFSILDLTGYTEERFSMSAGERVSTYHHAFSSDGYSVVLFPELNYNFGYGFELGAGGLVFLGKEHTKFGDPAAGGTTIWTRARFSF